MKTLRVRSKVSVIFVAISILLISLAPTSQADETLPPPTDASCAYSISGISCSNSISLSGSSSWSIGSDTGNPFVEWYLSLLTPGGNPSLISNYGPRVPQIKGPSGAVTMSVEFSYSDLVKFAQNSESSTVLVSAILFNGKGLATPVIGRQVSVSLIEVKNEMNNLKLAKEKAEAELKAKAEAEAKAKSEAEANAKMEAEAKAKSEAEAKARAESELKAKQEADARAKAESAARDLAEKTLCDERRTELSNLGNELKTFLKSQPTLAKDLGSTITRLNNALKSACISEVTLSDFKEEAETFSKTASYKKVTISCLKGKTIKKVTAVKPKCPRGYKKK